MITKVPPKAIEDTLPEGWQLIVRKVWHWQIMHGPNVMLDLWPTALKVREPYQTDPTRQCRTALEYIEAVRAMTKRIIESPE